MNIILRQVIRAQARMDHYLCTRYYSSMHTVGAGVCSQGDTDVQYCKNVILHYAILYISITLLHAPGPYYAVSYLLPVVHSMVTMSSIYLLATTVSMVVIYIGLQQVCQCISLLQTYVVQHVIYTMPLCTLLTLMMYHTVWCTSTDQSIRVPRLLTLGITTQHREVGNHMDGYLPQYDSTLTYHMVSNILLGPVDITKSSTTCYDTNHSHSDDVDGSSWY